MAEAKSASKEQNETIIPSTIALVKEIELIRATLAQENAASPRSGLGPGSPFDLEEAHSNSKSVQNDAKIGSLLKKSSKKSSISFESNPNDWMILEFYRGSLKVGTEDQSNAIRLLTSSKNHFLANKSRRMKFCFYAISALNLLAIISSEQNDLQKSKKHLDLAEQLYSERKRVPWNKETDYLFTQPLFEDEYTQTLFYLAQVYTRIGNNEKSSQFCFRTLERQCKSPQIIAKMTDPQRREWARNAMRISAYFIGNQKYRQAIHCMEAACLMAPDFEKSKDVEDDEEDLQLQADLAHTWGVLYLKILKDSYNAAQMSETETGLDSDEKKSPETPRGNGEKLIRELDSKLNASTKEDNPIDNGLILFSGLTKKLKSPPLISYAQTFIEARELFVSGLNHNKNALKFYLLDGFVTDHATISKEISDLYKYLAFFEESVGNRCKMHRRRLNLLEGIENQLSPSAYPGICKEFAWEIGQIYENMAMEKKTEMNAKRLEKLKEEKDPAKIKKMIKLNSKKIDKINELFTRSIHYLSKFVDFHENQSAGGDSPSNEIEKEFRYEYILAHWQMAGIYGKLIYKEGSRQLEAVGMSLKGYEHVCRFYLECGGIPGFQEQYEIAKQLKDLLPLKLKGIQSQLS